MRQLLSVCVEFAAAPLILIPLFLILNKVWFHNRRNTVLYTLLAIYLAGVWYVVGLPNVRYCRFDPNLNFVPFAGMLADLQGTLLNILLFIPLGIFLTTLWARFRSIGSCVLFGFSVSLFIELLQMLTFRATDVNDLITNTLGTLLGWILGHTVIKVRPRMCLDQKESDLPVVFGTTICAMFFVYPFLYPLVWNLFF